jgi:hypothetical protein
MLAPDWRKVTNVKDRAIAQALSCWPPTAARVRSQVRSCGICGWKCGTWASFCPSTSVSPANSHSARCFMLLYYSIACTRGQLVADVPSGLSLTPPHEIKRSINENLCQPIPLLAYPVVRLMRFQRLHIFLHIPSIILVRTWFWKLLKLQLFLRETAPEVSSHGFHNSK